MQLMKNVKAVTQPETSMQLALKQEGRAGRVLKLL